MRQLPIPAALLALLVALLLAAPHPAQAQADMDWIEKSGGQTYVIAYPDTTRNRYDERFRTKQIADTFALYIYSPVVTTVRITGNSYIDTVQVLAKQFRTIYLNSSSHLAPYQVVDSSGRSSASVFRLEADGPVLVYCYMATKFGGEMWTPLAVEAWGREYVATSMPGEIVEDISLPIAESRWDKMAHPAPAEITVVTAFDNTQVVITADSAGMFAGAPALTVTLASNRAYQLQSLVDTARARAGLPLVDLTGVRITASRPIGVISANTRSDGGNDSAAALARNSMKNMLVEWLAPVEQHGRQFVALPTMDDRKLTGQPGEKTGEKRLGEVVRIVTASSEPMDVILFDTAGLRDTVAVAPGESYEEIRSFPRAHAYRTSLPAQGMMIPWTVVRNVSATGGAGIFDTWGSFMTTMTPREQWVTYAPYIAPVHPGLMKHYINVVTDTLSKERIFDESGSMLSGWLPIPGTDLCWTTRQVTPGITKYFRGNDTSARFAAYGYGLLIAHEEFRPSSWRSEYEEYMAVAYGHPLAPSRVVLRAPDSISVTTSQRCDTMDVEVRVTNPDGVIGLRRIVLDPGSVNVMMEWVSDSDRVMGDTVLRLRLLARDRFTNATGTLIIVDRTAREVRVPYSFEAERVNIHPGTETDFGEVTLNSRVDTVITLTNPLNTPVRVEGIGLSLAANSGFTIIEPSPLPTVANPLTLQPGQTVNIRVRFSPTQKNTNYVDTLMVKLECASLKLPLHGETVEPCIYVGDLNFGMFRPGVDGPRTLPLEICNQGRGSITFRHPSGGSVVQWSSTDFSVPQRTLDSLRDHVTLGPNECYTVDVTFTPSSIGLFRTTAKFWTSTDCIRDTSVWTARVENIGGVTWSAVASADPLVRPLPVHDRAEIVLRMRRAAAVEFVVMDGAGVEVLRAERSAGAGESRHALDLSALSAGVYYCTVTAGGAVWSLPLVVVR